MNALRTIYGTVENIVALVILGLLFIGLVFWLAAKEVIILVASISVWAMGAAFIVLLIVGLLLVIGWARLRLAMGKRDLAQVKRDTILAEVEAQSAIVDLDAKIKAIPLLLDQIATGRALPSGLANIASSAYPLPVIKHYEELLPGPEPPQFVRIEDYVRADNVSLRNLFLGLAANNEQIRGSLKELSHIGVGGTSRWGKSIFLQMLLYQILLAKEPTELYLSDLGGTSYVDFGLSYADNVASTEKMAAHLWDIAMERKKLYQATGQGIRSLDMYNSITGQNLPYTVFCCDETTVLMNQSKKLTQTLNDLVSYAGKYGVELILSGQNWKADSVSTIIRDQFSSRFQFKAMDRFQSAVLIPGSEAQDINVKGRCYAWIPERGQTIQVQAPFIEPETLRTVARPVHPILGDNLPVWDISPDDDQEAEPTPRETIICDMFDGGASFNQISKAINEGRTGGTYNDEIKSTLAKFNKIQL